MKIAIIGAGISGLGAAYLLKQDHEITLYEKNDYIGGHSRTVDVQAGPDKTPVDTGFIVFNDWNYPNLIGLFKELDVPYEKSNMSFGVSIDNGWLEYSSNGLFAQSRNIFRPKFWRMLADIVRFNRHSSHNLEKYKDMTLEEYLDHLNMGDWFRRYYLLAMGAAIWSCSIDTIMKFPAHVYLRFFKNHGLLNLIKRPQWYSVDGGSREYVSRIVSAIQGDIKTNCAAKRVIPDGDTIKVFDENGDEAMFDHVILACHADEALSLIESPTAEQKEVLGSFGYQENQIIVHADESFMPGNKKTWASWVYLSEGRRDQKNVVSLSYWMNNLQNLNTEHPVLVTLNPGRRPDENLIMDEHVFSHPIFDGPAVSAQEKIETIQGQNGLSFCGAYQRYGFHEDGLLSAVNVAKKLGATIPWA